MTQVFNDWNYKKEKCVWLICDPSGSFCTLKTRLQISLTKFWKIISKKWDYCLKEHLSLGTKQRNGLIMSENMVYYNLLNCTKNYNFVRYFTLKHWYHRKDLLVKLFFWLWVIRIFNLFLKGDILKWGDEVEYNLVRFNTNENGDKKAQLLLKAEEVLKVLQKAENEGMKNLPSLWRPEYAAYMVEGTPGNWQGFCKLNDIRVKIPRNS